MDSLYLLIPIALLLVTGAVLLFVWSVKSGQYDDLDTEGKRILFDSEPKKEKGTTETKSQAVGTAKNTDNSATRNKEI